MGKQAHFLCSSHGLSNEICLLDLVSDERMYFWVMSPYYQPGEREPKQKLYLAKVAARYFWKQVGSRNKRRGNGRTENNRHPTYSYKQVKAKRGNVV